MSSVLPLVLLLHAIAGPPSGSPLLRPGIDYTGPTYELPVLAGSGEAPFGLWAQERRPPDSLHRNSAMLWSSLEVSTDGFHLYGASWDELYRIQPKSGAYELLGKVTVARTQRTWFSGPLNIGYSTANHATTVDWVFRATVEALTVDDGITVMIDTSGTTALSATEDTLLFARDYSVPGIADFEVTVEWSQPSSSTVWIAVDVEQFAGPGDVFIHGMLAVAPDAVVDDAQGETLPIAGLTQSTDGTLLALSQGDWDVFGHAGLYALDVTTAGVFATRWSTPAVPLTAIEFRPDGTLIGAGAALYTVDALTGATVEVGTTGIAPIVDLDVAPNGRILGISYPADAPSQLLDLSPGLTPYPPRTLLPEGKWWGLAIRDRGFGFDPPLNPQPNRRSARKEGF
jgi:hypothetical protein